MPDEATKTERFDDFPVVSHRKVEEPWFGPGMTTGMSQFFAMLPPTGSVDGVTVKIHMK